MLGVGERSVADGGLLDRARERETLDELLDGAAVGRGGGVLVHGARGAGVSALLELSVARAQAGGLRTLIAAALPGGQTASFDVARRLLAPLDVDEDDDGSGEIQRMVAAVAVAVRGGPLALVVDDLESADAPSLRLFALLCRWAIGRPVALVLGVNDPVAEGTRTAHDELEAAAIDVLVPGPLSADGARLLLARELEDVPARAAARAAWEATGGSPALLVHTARDLRATGLPPDAEQLREVGERTAAVAVRRALPAGDPTIVAEAVAVLGDAVTLPRLAAITGLRPEAALDKLAATDVVRGGAHPRLARPADATALVRTLPAVRLARLRRAAADRLIADGEPLAAARQLLELPAPGPPQDAAALQAAAAASLDRGAPREAIVFLRRLLAELPSGPRRVDVLTSLGGVQVGVGDRGGMTTLREATNAAVTPAQIAAAAGALADALAAEGDGLEAERAFDAARRRLRDDPSAVGITPAAGVLLDVRVAEMTAWDVALTPAQDAVLERLEAASAWSPLAASAVIAARAREALAHGHPATEVVDLGLRAMADGTLAEHDAAAATALTVAMTLGYAGRPDLGLHHLAHITSRLRARSASLLLKPARTFRGALASMEGRLVDALADFQAEFGGEAVWQTRSDPLMTGFYIEALLDRGDVAAAGRLLDRVDLDTATLDLLAHAPFLYARARVRLERGDPYGALEDMLLCGRRLQAGGWITNAVVPWQGAAARLLHEQGDASGATQQAECALATAEAAQIAAPLARALRDRAALTSELADRLALLERSAEVARGAPSPLARAAALVDLGFAVLAAGQPARARTTAREALDIARDAGAEPLSRRATRLLLDSGGRPRRATGARELTPAERRVARLAAAGATNREIADELVLSAKTIETHLRATYRKLAIRSRAQLPEALRARDDG